MTERARNRLPSRAAFDKAVEMVRAHNLDDRGFSVSPDGTVTILPAAPAAPANDYDRWKQGK